MFGQIYMEMAMDTTMSYQEIVEEGESFFEEYGRGQHTGYKAFKRWQYWMKRCLDADGHMMTNAQAIENFEKFQEAQSSNGKRRRQNPIWTELGPTSAGNTNGWSAHLGRVSAIGVQADNPDHIIVGSPTGGVWKTTDCGVNWTPIYDEESNLDIYSLEINPHNPQDYLVGTWGAGVRRSRDGGLTWTDVPGIAKSTRIVDLAVNPLDSNNIIVVNEGGNIFQSRNGGQRFDNSLIHQGTLYDVEFMPGSATVVYVSGKNGVYRSEDGGWSFTEIMGPWKTSQAVYNPIMLAVTEDDPNYVYALEADNGGFGALYRSTDGGFTFTTQSHDNNGDNNIMGYDLTRKGGQAPRDMDIAVSPLNKDEVHIGGIMTRRSLDGGVTWEQTSHWLRNDPLPFIHADIDIIEYVNGRLFFGTDGGLFVSDDAALSFTDKSEGLSIRQFYRIEVSEDGLDLVGGSQDNGTGVYKEGNGWWDFLGADGMEPVIDKDDKNIIYGSIQYGFVYKTVDGGVTLIGGVFQSPGRGDWVTPIVQDPVLPNTIYQGKQQLHVSTDGFSTWAPISNFVMNNPLDTLMQEMDISPIDNKTIVVGFGEQLFRTTDGGLSWTDITPPFAFSNVNYISIHPHDKNWISLALSGTNSRIVQTTDGGLTWTDLMNNLPDLGAECVIYEGGPKNGMYVAMNPGIYYKNSEQTDWVLISQGMPNVLVAELEINGCDLYAATFGRGVWKTQIQDDTEVYADSDGDGYGDDSALITYCSANIGYVLNGGDCDDTNASVNPAAAEICNGLDDNCDGDVDVSNTQFVGAQVWYQDMDQDGYGDATNVLWSCQQPLNYVNNQQDCNDSNGIIYPNAEELCDDIDNNCNGSIDENCTDCDGNFLYIHYSLQEEYRAANNLYSDAIVEGTSAQLFTAGNSIDLLPGFEVKPNKQFEARIEPCFNGVSPVSATLEKELKIVNKDLNDKIIKGELVTVKIVTETNRTHLVMFFKKEVNLQSILSQLETGTYVIYVDSTSVEWNREFQVIAS